ncbi:uncharacterized protein B0H64DRAFT_429075 [Chaetomium fimeti]|uniref:Uncharacterized protein n=1 Tax=Chaetomium fimeti TaxID=1854472 RepID=A0AAE0HRM9_9PEZI|nr:hypothetical protein B0H64DRAFT_429075 [Chaetomium fimeti]
MHPVLCQLRCWASSDDTDDATVIGQPEATKFEGVNFSSARPLCAPLPHFYEETWAYIRGNIWVINKLPGVKIKALKLAQQSPSRAAPVKQQKNASSSQSRAEFLSWLRERSQKIQQRMLLALKTPRRRATGDGKASLSLAVKRRSFQILVQHEIDQIVTKASTRRTSATSETLKPSPGAIGIAMTTPDHYLVYDGLRSSPPTTRTSPHTWKSYTGPFSSPQPAKEADDVSEDAYSNGPDSLTPEELLAALLFRWQRIRRGFPKSDAALASLADAIDWTGAEGAFAAESYTQRVSK